MPKKYYLITVGGYISELKIDTVSKEFLEYWKDNESGLLDAMNGYWDGVPDEMMPPFDNWCEADGVCSINSIVEDSEYDLQEIDPHPDTKFVDGELKWKNGKEPPYDENNPFRDKRFEFLGNSKKILGNSIGDEAEVYWSNLDEGEDRKDSLTPIVIFHAVDKGLLGYIFIVLENEDFNPKRFQQSHIETNAGMFTSQWWYDRKPLTLEYVGDTTGKSFETSFGFIDLDAQYSREYSYTTEGKEKKDLREAFDEWYANNVDI